MPPVLVAEFAGEKQRLVFFALSQKQAERVSVGQTLRLLLRELRVDAVYVVRGVIEQLVENIGVIFIMKIQRAPADLRHTANVCDGGRGNCHSNG